MSAVSSVTQFPITTLRIAITGSNNLNSFYDKPLGRHHDVNNQADRFGPAEYNKIAKAAGEAGIERILIYGAEPLLRKDVSSVVKALCSSKKIQEVRFITNGIFLKDFADSLRRAGLKHVEINLDSLNFMVYQKITRRDGLYRVLDGLQKCERIRFDSLTLNVILLRGVNEREIVDFAIMTKTRQLHIRFLEFQADSDAQLTKQLFYPVHEAKRIIQDFQALLPVDEYPLDGFKFKDGEGVVSFTPLPNTHLCCTTPQLVLNSQGTLYVTEPNGRSANLLKEFEKDGPDDRLQKAFQRLMTPTAKAAEAAAIKELANASDKAENAKGRGRSRNNQAQV